MNRWRTFPRLPGCPHGECQGGGSLLIAVMALVFPPIVVVSVHGCIQLGSNGSREELEQAGAGRLFTRPAELALLAG